jgi:hypothetical protein
MLDHIQQQYNVEAAGYFGTSSQLECKVFCFAAPSQLQGLGRNIEPLALRVGERLAHPAYDLARSAPNVRDRLRHNAIAMEDFDYL